MHGGIIARALIFVSDDKADGRAQGGALFQAGENFYLVGLCAGGRKSALAGSATVQLRLDICFAQCQAGQAAINAATECRGM